MKKILDAIITFFKNIFGQDINVSVIKETKYNINKNKKCNINISDGEKNNEKE